jgi:divalent metal cation (Fe/Co/Zn/Cd) transporter
MRIQTAGSLLIGGILFATGIAVLASSIDPAVLCFKRCDLQRLVVITLGKDVARVVSGVALAGVGAAFLVLALQIFRKDQD